MATIHGAEVAKHGKQDSCWVVIHGKVWDVTSFLGEHPGGAAVILKGAGRDATEAYSEIHDPELITQTLPAASCLGSLQPDTLPQVEDDTAVVQESSGASKPTYPPLTSIVNVDDFEKAAEGYLSATGWAYYSSGAEDEISIAEMRRLFRKLSLRPRVLRRVDPISTATNILGFPSSLPIYISPTGIGRYAHPDAEPILTKVAGSEGIAYCMPTTAPIEAINAARVTPEQPLFFQLYAPEDREKTISMIRRAEHLGAKALFMTVDSPVIGRRERDARINGTSNSGSSGLAKTSSRGLLNPLLTWDDVAWMRSITQLPVVIKGIQTVEDAVLAHRSGVQGIVLSNHGGRSQDTSQAPMLVLLEIRKYAPQLLSEEVRSKFQIFIDGGVRRGTDVLKALALGASGVGIGRPFLYSMTNNYGEDGARLLVDMFRGEIETNMALVGAASIKELVPEMVNSERAERQVSRRLKL
ncbi:glycolate oxidase [Thozetella sp. PMI_491]|nr:glycolate oxidase [Thozetella sp. PMI_491]